MDEEINKQRSDWLQDHGRHEGDVMWDDDGLEFIIVIGDSEGKKRVYLPPHIRTNESI